MALRQNHPIGRRLRGVVVLLACLGLAVPVVAATGTSSGSRGAAAVVEAAREQVGDTYTWGGNGPDTWDCSGFTSVLWREVGGVRSVPRTSGEQQAWAVPLPREQLLPGDLVFYGVPVDHVAIYAGGGMLVDASSSRRGVVQRPMWRSDTARYGRVPRPGMPAVRPWTPPPLPTPSPEPAATPPPSGSASEPGPARPGADRAVSPTARTPLRGLPRRQAGPSSRTARKAVAGARSVVGLRTFTDVSLVREAWRHAGGGTLPASRAALVARGRAVPLSDVRVGDLVSYSSPNTSVALYAGSGFMVQASRAYGKVVVRRVFAGSGVRFVRLG